MFDESEGTRHLAFFAELAALEDGDPSWRAVSAGLVVLRLVDAWIEEGAAAVTADGWGVRSVEAAIEEMQEGVPARSVLRSVVTALKSSPPNDMRAIAPRLLAYGRALDLDAKWALAADVYETVIAHVHPVEESDVAITAHIRLAFSLRSLGEVDRSSAAYDVASEIGRLTGDLVGILRAQIGHARISILRGNLPEAERELDDAITRSEHEGLSDLHAIALQERADVAHLRGQYDSAVRYAYRALRETNDPINRDRLLTDIAGSFYLLGARSVARDAYLVLEATAQEQYQRWVAAINLMEIASVDGSMAIFERYRRHLTGQALPPLLQTQLQLHIGEGYLNLGNAESAREALLRARGLAGNFQFNQLLFAAEQRLASLEAVPTATPEIALAEDDLRLIADEIRRRGARLVDA